MNSLNRKKNKVVAIRSVLVAIVITLGGCESYLAVDMPHNQLVPEAVFQDDALANGAVAAIYQDIMVSRTSHFANGGDNSVTALTDVAAGVLLYNLNSANVGEFAARNWLPDNDAVNTLWASAYKTIFQANEVLDGLATYGGVTAALASQLRGEALFMRAFCHHQLVQLFGGVPLVLTSDYRVTQQLPRSAPQVVYDHVENDLKEAVDLLPGDYSHALDERVRPNRWAAQLLLARVYAYQQRWAEAGDAAAAVIGQTGWYDLVPIEEVYLKNNHEAIWQLFVLENSRASHEGAQALPNDALTTPPRYSYAAEVLDALEPADLRLREWVGSYTMPNGVDVYNYVAKYKIRQSPMGERPDEYSMVLRLTEAYLLRAEARLKQGDVGGAIADVNAVREAHSGLEPLAGLEAGAVMDVIERERLIEFTYEWGHRWADLKRWGRNDLLLPIPQRELEANPFLIQNPDY
ncbi:RagB/SusD family nutrient uptake outer membrane protein [Parapedobacter soli]|uniref:RagB/SusD family nutrient uptake outer membrane protein n=1 Tax=Parapedobacter soli TaxID=416955 RepID=UPI0021CAB54F|nr:RagB/SusD family nutrient uptake outer membrane protein [Parapedobacter soli]